MRHLFSSESVTSGHPDKVCDQVSDSLLDAFLTDDPMTRAAIETTACPDFIHVMGEVTTKSKADVEQVVRETVRRIGYTKDEYLFTDKAKLVVSLHAQSPDIAMGVDSTEELGAGDQGMMFGFATNECDNLMPLGLNLARALTTALTEKRRSGQLPFLRPDGKAQVTLEYDGAKALRCSTIVLSAQHDEDISIGDLRQTLKEEVILKCIPSPLIDEGTRFLINPTGRFWRLPARWWRILWQGCHQGRPLSLLCGTQYSQDNRRCSHRRPLPCPTGLCDRHKQACLRTC